MRRPSPFILNRFAIVHIVTLISWIGRAVYVTSAQADARFALGDPGDMPIAGNWDGVP